MQSSFRVRVTDKQKAISYYENRSFEYEATVSRWPLSLLRDRERSAILELASLDHPNCKTVLDAGCGNGFYSLIAKQKGKRVCAIDLSPGMIRKLQDKVDWCEVADIESFKTEMAFDLVICSGVLEFVLNPESTFKRLSQTLSSQGRLVIQVPRQGLFGFIYRIEKRLFGISVNLYSVCWFERMAENQGLKLKDVLYPLPTNMVLCFEKQ